MSKIYKVTVVQTELYETEQLVEAESKEEAEAAVRAMFNEKGESDEELNWQQVDWRISGFRTEEFHPQQTQ
jgi:hypothetical protein